MFRKFLLLLFCALFCTFVLLSQSEARKLYKYKDELGRWHFSDRPPSTEQTVSVEQLRIDKRPSKVAVQRRGPNDASDLHIINNYHGPVEVEIELREALNIRATPNLPHRFVVSAREELRAVLLRIGIPNKRWRYRYAYGFTLGDPKAKHNTNVLYRAPFSAGVQFRISQAFNGPYSHNLPYSRYAVDIPMPEGTPIHAARSGIVMEVASDFFEGGVDREKYGSRANLIRILHDDGTMAVYAHLALESAAVVEGMNVTAGQLLALSGNTGFSSGPHLHFVVQKNAGRELIAVPFNFTGPDRTPLRPERGLTLQVFP